MKTIPNTKYQLPSELKIIEFQIENSFGNQNLVIRIGEGL